MNIKSELRKPFKWCEAISLSLILYSIIFGIFGSLIIVVGAFATFVKAGFIGFSIFVMLIFASEINSKSEQRLTFKQFGFFIIFSLMFGEIGLYLNSDYTNHIPINTIVIDVTRDITVDDKTVKEKYKKVEFYNLNNNKKIDYELVESGEEGKLEFFSNITGMETYIEYTPFIRYSEETKYIRK